MGGVAHAADKPNHAAKECIELLEQGKTIDDCQESPNPILPETNELVWGGLAFVVLLGLMWKFGLPPVRKMLKDREDRIRGDLERAEQAKVEAEGVLEDYRRQLAEARTEASQIIEASREQAEEVRRELIAKAETDAAEVRQRAAEDARLAGDRVMSELRCERRRPVDRAGREGRRAQPRPRHPDPAHRELHQPGREPVAMSDGSRIEAYARAMLEVARAEGRLAEVEDELFRFARTFDGSDDLRMALSDPALPADRRVAVVQDLLGAKALQTSVALAEFVVSVGSGRRPPADRRPVRGARGARSGARRWPRCAARCRSPPTRSSGCATRWATRRTRTSSCKWSSTRRCSAA